MRSYNFNITPEQATDYAQKEHNRIDQNGEIDEEKIAEIFIDEHVDKLYEWFMENVDWDKILEDDLDMRDTIAEIEEAERGEY